MTLETEVLKTALCPRGARANVISLHDVQVADEVLHVVCEFWKKEEEHQSLHVAEFRYM
jgi:hypothetical protein